MAELSEKELIDELSQNELVQDLISEHGMLGLYIFMFKNRMFDFIVTGQANNSEGDWEEGDTATHEKQKRALEILTDKEHNEFLYGGAAGGAKSWTGVSWITFSALAYPNTNWFIARNQISDLLDSVYKTFLKVCRQYGITDFKFNGQKNFIEFPNGSVINLIEVKYKPSDPMYEDIGSTEYTGGWIEEIGEVHEMAAIVLSTRTGRQENKKYGLTKKLFMTCNPKKNWAKTKFYDKHINGELEKENNTPLPNGKLPPKRVYLDCLVTENPFIDQEYIDDLYSKARDSKPIYERLFKGNWEYEDNPYQLAEQEMIEMVFDNNHIKDGRTYITADVARMGSDKARIGVWSGWNLIEVISRDVSKTTEIELDIMQLRRKYNVPKNRCIADEDGVGGGVVDGAGILGFRNGSSPIKENRDTPNYKNLQTQCLYILADKINEGSVWISAELSNTEKQEIKAEFSQIQAKGEQDPERKLECKNKADIKADIGRSPDWRDMILMRVYFDLKPVRNNLVRRVPR